jgi:hypothetical protein
MACSRRLPHISALGRSPAHTAGRSGCPKILQRRSPSNCTQGTPAGLPAGMPGMGLVMDGAMQQAAQPSRQVSPSEMRGTDRRNAQGGKAKLDGVAGLRDRGLKGDD